MAAVPAAPDVYRPVATRIMFVVLVAGALWWVVEAARHAATRGDLLVGVPALVAAGALAYALLWRPAVVVGADSVRLLNVLRDVEVPWSALEAIETRYALTLVTADGVHRSWAAAAPGRPALLRTVSGQSRDHAAGRRGEHHLPDPRWTAGGGSQAPASSRDLSADSGAAAFLVEQAWARWRDTPSRLRADGGRAASVRWNVPLSAVVVAGAVVAALAIVLT